MQTSATAALLGLLIAACATPPARAAKTAADYIAEAPFKMTMPAEPVIPNRTFNLADYGAVPDGQTLNSAAFAKAIDAVKAAGGGHLIVPQGLWLTGPIMLCSNLDLHLEAGALVLFTPDHTQFPIINASDDAKKPSWVVQPLLYGRNLENIAITGQGTFDGCGETWRPVKKGKMTDDQWKKLTGSGGVVSGREGKGKSEDSTWYPSVGARDGDKITSKLNRKTATAQDYLPARDAMRPKMFEIHGCDKVLLDGPTFKNSPKFVINPHHCANLIIRNINVNNEWWAQNGDGIDISESHDVLLYNCRVTCGDDGICMKSSGDGKEFALHNVVIAACSVYHAHGGFVCGSNTSGGMRDVYVTDCTYIDTDVGIRIKSADDRGGVVRDIYIQNIVMHNILNEAVLFDSFYAHSTSDTGAKQPEFCHFSVKNVRCHGAGAAMVVNAGKNSPVHDLYFEDVTISAAKGVTMSNAKDIVFNKVTIITPAKPAFSMNNVVNFIEQK